MNLAILIVTCDKDSYIWDTWYYYFKKNFPQGIGKLYWTNETIDCPYPEFTQIKVDIKNINKWTKGVRQVVKKISEDNILFLLGDLLLIEQCYEFHRLCIHFTNFNMDALQIMKSTSKLLKDEPTHIPRLTKLKKYSWYLISYSVNLYKKKFLLECLRMTYSPWDSEIKGTRRLWIKAFLGRKYKIYNYRKNWVVNLIIRGEIDKRHKKYIK